MEYFICKYLFLQYCGLIIFHLTKNCFDQKFALLYCMSKVEASQNQEMILGNNSNSDVVHSICI